MKNEDVGTDAERALREYERKIATMRPDGIDLVAMEASTTRRSGWCR
jgi:hypothetical protein